MFYLLFLFLWNQTIWSIQIDITVSGPQQSISERTNALRRTILDILIGRFYCNYENTQQ